MADGTSTWGVDTSRYQPLGTYDPGQFEVINIEDPGWLDKWLRNLSEGRPTGFYLWVYPGHRLDSDTHWAVEKIRSAGLGDPQVGLWADYEEAGVEQWQLDQFFAVADTLGMKSGYYASPHSLNHDPYLNRPFWLAVYPNSNDGSFPGYGSLYASSRPRPLQIWQYTSTANGPAGLDKNVIVDDAWWAEFIGAPTTPPKEIEDMAKDNYYAHRPNVMEAWEMSGNTKRLLSGSEWRFWNDVSAFLGLPAPTNVEIPVEMFDAIPVVGTVDAKSLAAELIKVLPVGTVLTPAQVEQALRNVLHNA